MKHIPLGRTGLTALVDDDDYDRLIGMGNWTVVRAATTTYACRQYRDPDTGRLTSVQMHQVVAGYTFVDHVNGDGLDNRRTNLRPADHSLNGANRRLGSNNTSGYKGVSRHKTRWQAVLRAKGQRYYLGSYATAEQAARAYDAAAAEHFGPYARLNFPRQETTHAR